MAHEILVVDENAATLAALLEAFSSAGHPAIGAASFRDGVRLLTTTTPALLVCTLHLGPYNGLHLVVRGRAEHPDLPAILIGPPSEVVAREARALGAALYLPEPLDVDALIAAVPGLFEAAGELERVVAGSSAAAAYAPV
jgi:DNA-binding response OmpR family regulator